MLDLTVDKCTDTLTYQYMINYLSHHFESSKNLGHDAVFIHIAKNNQLKGKCFWMDEDLIEKYRKRVERLEPLLIGQHAKELLIPDTSDNWHSSHALPKEYVIIWFKARGTSPARQAEQTISPSWYCSSNSWSIRGL